jgi:hypothetical protein
MALNDLLMFGIRKKFISLNEIQIFVHFGENYSRNQPFSQERIDFTAVVPVPTAVLTVADIGFAQSPTA